MSAPFDLADPLLALCLADFWPAPLAHYSYRSDPERMRQALHAQTRALVFNDRALNGWAE